MKWIVAYLSLISSSVISAVLLGLVFKGINKGIAIACLLIGITVFIFIVRTYRDLSSSLKKSDFTFWSYFVIVCFLLFSCRSFFWYLFQKGHGLNVLSPHNIGDACIHISYIHYITNGAPFWLDSPILTGQKVSHQIGMDIFNSLLLLSGMDLIRTFIWVGILSSVATLYGLFTWGKAFAVAGFLFNGGLAGFLFFQKFIFDDYQVNLFWKSIPLTIFVTQRGYLFAIPVGLLLLNSWRYKFFSNQDDKGLTLPLWIEILFLSSMPLFNLDTFIFFMLLLIYWLVFLSNTQRLMILKPLLFSLAPSLIFVVLLTNFFKDASLIDIHFGMLNNNQNPFIFWLWNFGIFLVLAVFLYVVLLIGRIQSGKILDTANSSTAFSFPAIFFFCLFSIVIIHKNQWDNIAVLMWCYIVLLPYIWEVLLRNWDSSYQRAICFLLFFSGFVCLYGGINNKFTGHEIFKLGEARGVCSSIKNESLDYRFASFPVHNHPLLYCGRKVVLGFPGWTHSYGSYSEDVEKKLKSLMLGESNWKEIAKELKVRYIFWGEREKVEYSSSLKPWENTAKKIASGGWGEIYDLGE